VKAGDDWRQTLYRELDEARAMVCLCSEGYESSPWCVGEVAIAVKDGKTVIPIQLGKTAEERAVAVASAGEPGYPGA
jgi:hypothetical protein